MFKFRKKISSKPLEPDEIFLDSKNMPGFERERFEGRLEHPLSSKTFRNVGFAVFLLGIIFLSKAFNLQVQKGDELLARAEANRLKIQPLWPERGLILDRRGEIIADNEPAFRLVLEGGELAAADNLDSLEQKLSELKTEIGDKMQFPADEFDKHISSALKTKQNLVLGTFYDWTEAEKIRRSKMDLPLVVESFSTRSYLEKEAISHLVGYIGYPNEEDIAAGGRFQSFIGRTGVEEKRDSDLRGRVGSKLTEINSEGGISSEAVQEPSENGENIYLTIDLGLQNQVYKSIKEIVDDRGFKGGSAVLLDVDTGEVLSLVSYPGFDPALISRGKPREEVQNILKDERNPLFNRAISGLYPAGSVFKSIIALAGLEENIISPEKQILSTREMLVPNPFNPSNPTIFYDWKAHGWVDMRHALAVSSNVYFYHVGGGFGDVKGLGVRKIKEWAQKFGLGRKTGIDLSGEKDGFLPDPDWKALTMPEDPIWRVGDTYNLSIGQGSMQVTPVQMAVATAAIANGGNILEPHVVKMGKDGEKIIYEASPVVRSSLGAGEENLQIVREGMRLAAEIGTATALSGLKVKVAGKTGTAEIGSGKRVNSWFIGFMPYDRPKVAMVVTLEAGSSSNLVGASAASRQIVDWLSVYRPKLLEPLSN